jgi:Zn-dependent protease
VNPSGIPVARLFGIEIRVSLTWVILIAIVTLIGAEQATLSAPSLAPVLQWVVGGGVAVTFLASVLAHELAHSLVARRRGVPAAPIVLGFVGGLAPLAIQARRPTDELAIAVAGPFLSLGIAVAILTIGGFVGLAAPGLEPIAGGLVVVGGLNLGLGILSLVPGLPLDGGRVVRALAWHRTHDVDRANRITARIGRLFGWSSTGLGVVLALTGLTTAGLLVLSMGWFLTTGARTIDRRSRMEQLLRGIPVADAMERDVPWVGPHLTIDTFANRYEGEDAVSALAVVEHDRVLGVLGAQRVKRLGRRRFASTRAADVMASPPQAPLLAPADALWSAIEALGQAGLDGLAVIEDGRLAGMLTRRSLATIIQARVAGSAAGTASTP